MGGGKDAPGAEQEVIVYLKAGVDGERLGACPFCQRVYMVVMIKARHGLLKYKAILCTPAKPPQELKKIGLKQLPAIIHGDEGFDAVDDVIAYLDDRFPGGGLTYDCPEADLACKDFFSKFCFFIKAVNQDSSKLNHALGKLDAFLESTTPPPSLPSISPPPKSPTTITSSSIPTSPSLTAKSLSSLSSPESSSPTPSLISTSSVTPASPTLTSPIHSPVPSSPSSGAKNGVTATGNRTQVPPTLLPYSVTNWPSMVPNGGNKASANTGMLSLTEGTHQHEEPDHVTTWVCGGRQMNHLDCEVLPKLQHLRVAAAALKGYQLPSTLQGCWRYLHTAYSEATFVQTCPADQEIILHWHDRPETQKLSHKMHAAIAKEKPKYSFDVPVRASVVTVVEVD